LLCPKLLWFLIPKITIKQMNYLIKRESEVFRYFHRWLGRLSKYSLTYQIHLD
jgi:hypothetical protein